MPEKNKQKNRKVQKTYDFKVGDTLELFKESLSEYLRKIWISTYDMTAIFLKLLQLVVDLEKTFMLTNLI